MSAKPCQLRMYRQRKLDGLCVDCGKNPSLGGDRVRCEPCADNIRARGAKSRRKKGTVRKVFICINGKCFTCGKNNGSTEEYSPCHECHFRLLATTNLGTCHRWKEMESIWNRQNGTCPYTGIRLDFGVDASLDHILPQSRYPHLADDINNMEFVHIHVNHMKKNMTKEEFIEFLRMLSMNLFPPEKEVSPWAESLAIGFDQ